VHSIHPHIANVAANLQLVADLGYAAVTLAVPDAAGALQVLADARPHTAVAPLASSRQGSSLPRQDELEAYAALAAGEVVAGRRTRQARDLVYSTAAYPVGAPRTIAVVVLDRAAQVTAAPGRMETAFMRAAEDLIAVLRAGPILEVETGEPYSTSRQAGDGLLRVGGSGRVSFASPNAVTIMRSAGVAGRVTASQASELPGGMIGISPVLGGRGALSVEVEVAERVLAYRSLALPAGALVLVEDRTEARRRERELGVKEATIREVHHRVKNNLQTIASLLRIQARRSQNNEVRRALGEATERAAAMAAVHDLLARSDGESVDFAEAVRTVVELVRRGLVGDDPRVTVQVTGSTGLIHATAATSLALAVAELVHNALEHAFEPGTKGSVEVALLRSPGELSVTVRDDGRGLAAGFDPAHSPSLGFSIVRTLVEEDLRGSLIAAGGNGTSVTIRVPLRDAEGTAGETTEP
jgi:two-component system, sensor histidine kinase PdtaS